MPRLTVDAKYRRLLAWLRRTFPLQRPACVRRVPLKEYCGVCTFSADRKFYIQIDNRQCAQLACDSLIHEWAHALTWFSPCNDHHSAEWGIAYARLYRCYLTWNYGQPQE
jgi:hypothetical protein